MHKAGCCRELQQPFCKFEMKGEHMEAGGQTYLRMMSDILRKKETHLQELLTLTKEQEHLLRAEEFDDEAFNRTIEKKDVHIKKIQEFDSGFQTIYNRIEEELKQHGAEMKEEVQNLQRLITKVTELGVSLQALEQKNKASMEARLLERKRGIKQFKVSRQTASHYYKNMVDVQQGTFMDEKQ